MCPFVRGRVCRCISFGEDTINVQNYKNIPIYNLYKCENEYFCDIFRYEDY